ncbi:high mobility group box domain-containing protein, partial [Russula compacta]
MTSSLSPDVPATPSGTHRRRRSTVSDISERRPKKGDEDYIKRPENAFILFRRKCCEDRNLAQGAGDAGEGDGSAPPTKKQRQADLSKMISQQWKSLSAEERQYWEDLAKEKKKEHEALYPNYVYRP